MILIGSVGVLSIGGFGLLLADSGHFSPSLALAVGAAGTVVGVLLARPRWVRSSASASRGATLPAVGMCGVAGAIGLWNSIYIGHHVSVDSDPGVYAVTGRWLADHQSLIVPAGTAWGHTGLNVTTGSPGLYPQPNGTVEFQFAHLLGVLLAAMDSIGGDGLMFRTPALLGALGLGAIYLVGCQLIGRPWVVLAAVAALGVSLPELFVTRDTYSEPATQVLLWSGIWLLVRSCRERRFWLSFMTGLLIGGTMMTHIDAVIYLAPLPVLAAVSWLAAKSSSDQRSLLRVFAGVLLGVVPPALLGTFDVQRRAGQYYDDLHSQVVPLYGALAGATIAAVILVVVWSTLPSLRSALVTRRRQIGVGASWVVAGALLWAWALRPAGPEATEHAPFSVIAALQKLENVPVRPTRTYAEQSMVWFGWYIGPVALALAIGGICLLVYRVINRGWGPGLLLLAMTGPLTALYLWRPSITPDQIWAMRRYVPDSLPLFLLAAAMAVDAMVSFCASRLSGSAWPRRTLAAAATGLLAFPLGASLQVGRFEPQANFYALVASTCRVIGPQSAVLFPAADVDASGLSQTIRSFCNVPVAQLSAPITHGQLELAAADLRSEGKTLWLLGNSSADIVAAVPGVAPQLIGTVANPHEMAATVTRPPSSYIRVVLTVFGAKVAS